MRTRHGNGREKTTSTIWSAGNQARKNRNLEIHTGVKKRTNRTDEDVENHKTKVYIKNKTARTKCALKSIYFFAYCVLLVCI